MKRAPLLVALAIVASAALSLALVACGVGVRQKAAEAIGKPPGVGQVAPVIAPAVTGERARVEDAQAEVDRLTGKLREAEKKVETAKEAEREARLAGVRILITWLTAICVLVGVLSVGLFFFLRMKSLLLLTAACGGMIAAGQATTILLDHPLLAGSGLAAIVLGAVLLILWKQRHTERGLLAAVNVAESLKPEPGSEDDVDRMERRLMQSKLVREAGKGADKAIEFARAKLKLG